MICRPGSNNLGLDIFPDTVGNFGAPWWPFWILQAVGCLCWLMYCTIHITVGHCTVIYTLLFVDVLYNCQPPRASANLELTLFSQGHYNKNNKNKKNKNYTNKIY